MSAPFSRLTDPAPEVWDEWVTPREREDTMSKWTPPSEADVEQFLDACDKIEEAFGKPPLDAEQRARAAEILRTPPDPAEEPTPEQERMLAAWVAMRKSGARGGTA